MQALDDSRLLSILHLTQRNLVGLVAKDKEKFKCIKLSSKSRVRLQAPNVLTQTQLKKVEGQQFISWIRTYAVYFKAQQSLRFVKLPLTLIEELLGLTQQLKETYDTK